MGLGMALPLPVYIWYTIRVLASAPLSIHLHLPIYAPTDSTPTTAHHMHHLSQWHALALQITI